MSALYIHIPFCRTRCIYCDFHSGTDMSLQERYIEALCTEAALRADELPAPVETLYLGGGTPSQLSPALLHKLFTGLSQHIETAHCIETTIECNPDDLTPLYIEALTKLPINRISMGIQSFDDGELHFLRRRHTAQAAIDAVERCRPGSLPVTARKAAERLRASLPLKQHLDLRGGVAARREERKAGGRTGGDNGIDAARRTRSGGARLRRPADIEQHLVVRT